MTLFSTVLAQTTINLKPGGPFSGAEALTLEQMIGWAISAILVVAALAFFFMLILGGIKWILSGGDKGNTEAARNQVTAAIIGLVVVFSAWIIMTFIFNLFGVNIFSFSVGTISSGVQ